MVRSTPNKVWQLFTIIRGAGKYGEGDRTHMLSSDLCKIPEFKAEEDKARATIRTVSETIGLITEILEQINRLVTEAMQFSC